ncbi:MAG: thioredoxin family protein, partial [Erythrobacter sp.]|nr:thioredoxin family protein [Erythrobacter sp.]
TLDALRQEPRLKDAVFFKVDFDKEKAFLRQHRIPRQSTVLVFRGKQESVRSIAESRPKQLREAVMAGI